MNKTFYILFFVLASVFCNAQTNLIYNGDFEMYDTCPVSTSSPFSIPYEIERCLGWKAPTYATSDYFNTCNAGSVGVPLNIVGYQIAYSGDSYCGLIAYSYSSGGCYTGDYWWEYVQGKFINPLIAGHTYHIGFYVSLADISNIAVRQLGFYISTTAVGNVCSPAPLSYMPQIVSSTGSYLKDTTNWILIDGDYTAIGGEQYITIGNFKDSLTTDTMSVYPNVDPFSYYYVDAGSAYDITNEILLTNTFTPNNDGFNDLFYIPVLIEGDSYEIYDRWGILIFEGVYNKKWDGRNTAGLDCTDGVYYYIVKQRNNKTIKGFIQLLR